MKSFSDSVRHTPARCWRTLWLVFRFPVVAMGVLKWVDWTVSEPRYFQLQTDHTPVHLALLDEVQYEVTTRWKLHFPSFTAAVRFKHVHVLRRRSARVTSCCILRSSSCSSSCLRRSIRSWTSWSRCVFDRCCFSWSVCCNWGSESAAESLISLQMELKKTLLDRMVHLLSRGYVLPVVGYIRKCLEKLNTDISLIRYFVTEVTSSL